MHSLTTWLPRAALAVLPLLAGCSEAYWTANVRSSASFPTNSVLMTNADIRTINRIEGYERILQKARNPDGTFANHSEIRFQPRVFVCAEPSPDVARVVQAALSAAAAGSADVANPVAAGLTGASTLQASLSGRIDASRSEAISQLTRRIATIQLLRDGMYRACEAYANGAIGQEIYTAIVSRYDKIMVTMLLGEMASGNLPGMASASGTASAGQSAGTLLALTDKLTEVRKATDTADTKLKAAITDVATKEKDVAEKTKLLKDAKEADISSARAALDKANTDLEAARKAQAIDAKAADKAKDDVAAVERAIGLVSGQAAAGAQAGHKGASTSPAAEVAETLYKMLREYLNDSQLGTQVLICAAEAAQADRMGGIQQRFCDRIFDTAFPRSGGTPSTERARQVQLAELRNQGIARVMATLPPNATASQRQEALRAAQALFPPPR